MRTVKQAKNHHGHTRYVRCHSETEIRNGASRGVCVVVETKDGTTHRTGYFNNVDDALEATWFTNPKPWRPAPCA